VGRGVEVFEQIASSPQVHEAGCYSHIPSPTNVFSKGFEPGRIRERAEALQQAAAHESSRRKPDVACQASAAEPYRPARERQGVSAPARLGCTSLIPVPLTDRPSLKWETSPIQSAHGHRMANFWNEETRPPPPLWSPLIQGGGSEFWIGGFFAPAPGPALFPSGPEPRLSLERRDDGRKVFRGECRPLLADGSMSFSPEAKPRPCVSSGR
jgi:hypothetical protein